MIKDLIGYEGLYSIDNAGNFYSVKRNGCKGGVLKTSLNKRTGYVYVTVTKDGKLRSFTVHRLVAKHFVPNPNNLPQVNHDDGNKLNNNDWNLKWCTRDENMDHASKNFLCEHGENHHNSSLSNEQVLEIRDKYIPRKYSQHRLAKEYGVSQNTIMNIVNKSTWVHI